MWCKMVWNTFWWTAWRTEEDWCFPLFLSYSFLFFFFSQLRNFSLSLFSSWVSETYFLQSPVPCFSSPLPYCLHIINYEWLHFDSFFLSCLSPTLLQVLVLAARREMCLRGDFSSTTKQITKWETKCKQNQKCFC